MILNWLAVFQMMSLLGASTAFDEYIKSECQSKILINSNSGLQFYKSYNSDKTVNVTYDCSIGIRKQGTIHLSDENHGLEMKSLIIQNCSDITVILGLNDNSYGFDYFKSAVSFEHLKIINVHALTFQPHHYSLNQYYKNISIDIEAVKFLAIEEDGLKILNFPQKNVTINVKIRDSNVTRISIGPEVSNLYLDKVNIGFIKTDSISMHNENAVLVIKNSSFKNVPIQGIVFNGYHVEMFNNNFKNLEEGSFSVVAESFIFERNNVKSLNSFEVISPNVQIISNTFDISKKPWLSEIVITNSDKGMLTVLNISNNFMNTLTPGFFSMNQYSQPDLVYFKNNYFNCTCKYWNLINEREHPFTKNSQEILIFKNYENFCINLEKCPLFKVLNRMREVCQGKFICDQDKPEINLETISTTLLSTLNTMNDKLSTLITERNIGISKPNLSITEQPVTMNVNS